MRSNNIDRKAPQLIDMCIDRVEGLGAYVRLRLKPADGSQLPQILPGQFVQVKSPDDGVLLRRPISVHFVDYQDNCLWLMIAPVGQGTRAICCVKPGDNLSVLLPLGNSYCLDSELIANKRILLVGGGVGIAPLLYYAAWLKTHTAADVNVALAARNADALAVGSDFEKWTPVAYSTDDGSKGKKGLVTDNEMFDYKYDMMAVCGPAPMMKAVARIAAKKGIDCEVSLENMMACGLGACLCCVEKTVRGNVCVCTEGPVFNISQLNWNQ